MSDQSTEPSEEGTKAQSTNIDWDWHVRLFFVYAFLVMILFTLSDISNELSEQNNQQEQPSAEELDLAYRQVEILYETQQIICDALDGPNEQVSGTTPINTEEPSISTTTTTPAPTIPGESPSSAPAVDPIEAYC